MIIDTTNRPRFPTVEERNIIAEMYRSGVGAPEIGRRIRRSEHTVYQALRDRVAVDPTFPFPRAPGEHLRESREVIDRVLAMVAAGKSDADIGAAIGKSHHAVSAMICRLRRRGENVAVRAAKPPPIRKRAAPRLPFDRRPQAEKQQPLDVGRDAPGVRFACVSVNDLPPEQEPRGCRWIEGKLSTGAWRYCQAKPFEGSSWCEEHYVRAFRVGPEEEREAA